MKCRIERSGYSGHYSNGWWVLHPVEPYLSRWLPTWQAAIDLADFYARKATR